MEVNYCEMHNRVLRLGEWINVDMLFKQIADLLEIKKSRGQSLLFFKNSGFVELKASAQLLKRPKRT